MAPEIIEMHGATTTSDIWSVGCTIIELVTGNPPYFELDAMPALFRIVQDDSPPIPDNISPLLRDFLMTCFQKEPLLRSSAEMLLKHRWITTNIKKANAKPAEKSSKPTTTEPQAQVEDWNKKVEAKREEMKKAAPAESQKPKKKPKSPHTKAMALDSSSSSDDDGDYGSNFDIKSFQFPGTTTSPSSTTTTASGKTSGVNTTDSKSTSKPSSTATSTTTKTTSAKTSAAAKAAESDEEDWGDMAFESKPLSLSGKSGGGGDGEKAKLTAASKNTPTKKNADEDDNWDDMAFASPAPKHPSSMTSSAGSTPMKKSGTLRKSVVKSKDDDDNWDDLGSPLGSSSGNLRVNAGGSKMTGSSTANTTTTTTNQGTAASGSTSGGGVDLAAKLAMKMKSAWDTADQGEADPFDLFDDDEASDMDLNDDAVLEKTQAAHIASSAIRAIEGLNSFATEESILAHCDSIMAVFKDFPNEKSHIIARTGVIPFIEMLQMPNPKIVHATLKIVNVIVEDSAIRESFSVMGGIASTLQYSNRKFPRPIRQEASVFIKQMLSAGRKTMQLFIGARGLPVLVDFISIEDDFVQNKDLYLIGIDCIYSILTSNLQVRIPKNDFCRLFAKLSLLPHLARAFELVSKDHTTKNIYPDKIADIFIIFSKGDVVVKTHFGEQEVVRRLFNILPELPPSIFLKILKCVNALSMSSNTLENLSTAGAIKVLVPYMGRREGQLMMETHQQLFSTLYNLCRLNPGRQLVAAKAGILPHLQWVVQENHPLKQFALPILFEMARVKKIRDMMKPKDGVLFFLGLLKQQYPWQVQAMDCLAIWLGDDAVVAETIKSNLQPVIDVFLSSTTDEAFSKLFEHMLAMIERSEVVNIALSASPILDTVIERTDHKNILVRLNTLKILEAFFKVHPKPLVFVHQVQETVNGLRTDSAVLVRNLAIKLASKFKKALKHGGSSSSSSSSSSTGTSRTSKDTARKGTASSTAMAAALSGASSTSSTPTASSTSTTATTQGNSGSSASTLAAPSSTSTGSTRKTSTSSLHEKDKDSKDKDSKDKDSKDKDKHKEKSKK